MSYKLHAASFWRWHSVREIRDGVYVEPPSREPTHTEIIVELWNNTCANLHGFAFNKEVP